MRDVQWTGGVLYVRAVGPIAKDSVLAAARRVTADSRYDRLQFLVADFLDAEASDVRLLDLLEDLLALLLGATASNPNLRIAVVAQDPYIVQLAEALVWFSSNAMLQVCIFTERLAVSSWVSGQPRLSRPSMRFRPR